MNEETIIVKINDTYKEIYDEDVTIKYDEEKGVYVFVNDKNEIIGTTTSLEEVLEELDTQKKEIARNMSSNGISNTNSPTTNGKRRRSKIDMYVSGIVEVIGKLGQMANVSYDSNTEYDNCLTNELQTYYNGLNDKNKEALSNLGDMINGISQSTAASLSICLQSKDKDYQELKELINELYRINDVMVKKTNEASQDEPLSYDDYSYLFDNMDKIFDGRYQDILDTFKVNLVMGYQKFLEETVSETLDNLVENTYLRISFEEIGSQEYYEGLKKYKETFSLKILNNFNMDNFNIEESNIPKYLWDEADNYTKSLLMLSYNNDSFSNNYRDNIINTLTDAAKENDLEYTYIEDDLQALRNTFDILSKTNNFYNKDFDQAYADSNSIEKLNKIINEYTSILKSLEKKGMPQESFIVNFSVNPTDKEGSAKAWEKTLEELGYLKNTKDKYETSVLYQETFTN